MLQRDLLWIRRWQSREAEAADREPFVFLVLSEYSRCILKGHLNNRSISVLGRTCRYPEGTFLARREVLEQVVGRLQPVHGLHGQLILFG